MSVDKNTVFSLSTLTFLIFQLNNKHTGQTNVAQPGLFVELEKSNKQQKHK
jgi:hypothetical protein